MLALVLKDVIHVSDLRLNLVSELKLDDAVYNVNLSEKLKLSRGSLIVARESLCCSLYKLQAKIVGHEMNVLITILLNICAQAAWLN